MIYPKSSIDIIRDIVNSMTFPIEIKEILSSVENPAGTFTVVLKVCDIYHAEIGRTVTIDGITYTITAFTEGSEPQCSDIILPTITLKGSASITADTFNLYPPYFFHGTPINTNIEFVQQSKAILKTPFVWLVETFNDSFFDDDSNLEREINADIFFLTQANHEMNLIEAAYNQQVKPMRRLAEQFIDKMKSMYSTFYTDEYRPKFVNYPKFGVYIREKGVLENKFADKVAGCQLTGAITTRRNFVCADC